MNNGWDEFSIPKEVARSLIAMHVKRGDSIYFVTGRSQTKTETVSKTLQDDFLIPAANMNPVIFAGDKPGQNSKTQWLEHYNIYFFYGDSDNDITAAHDVGARGIRVLRASNSTYRPLPMAGKFGEEVFVNSEYFGMLVFCTNHACRVYLLSSCCTLKAAGTQAVSNPFRGELRCQFRRYSSTV